MKLGIAIGEIFERLALALRPESGDLCRHPSANLFQSRIRHDQEMQKEVSAEMALGLRSSLATIAGYAQQLAHSRDAGLARQLADDIAKEAAQLDRTIGSFLAGAKAATTSS